MDAVDGNAPASAPAAAINVQDVLGWLTENDTLLKCVGPPRSDAFVVREVNALFGTSLCLTAGCGLTRPPDWTALGLALRAPPRLRRPCQAVRACSPSGTCVKREYFAGNRRTQYVGCGSGPGSGCAPAVACSTSTLATEAPMPSPPPSRPAHARRSVRSDTRKRRWPCDRALRGGRH